MEKINDLVRKQIIKQKEIVENAKKREIELNILLEKEKNNSNQINKKI